jgi:hypothetical protein
MAEPFCFAIQPDRSTELPNYHYLYGYNGHLVVLLYLDSVSPRYHELLFELYIMSYCCKRVCSLLSQPHRSLSSTLGPEFDSPVFLSYKSNHLSRFQQDAYGCRRMSWALGGTSRPAREKFLLNAILWGQSFPRRLSFFCWACQYNYSHTELFSAPLDHCFFTFNIAVFF